MLRSTFTYFLVILPMVLAITSVRAESIQFEKTKTYDEIMRQAEAAERGFFVYYSAKWCAPCQIMDRNTFRDQNLQDYVNENFIAVKLDIDNRYGKIWQDQFNVQAIPTIIFFDQWGNEIQRVTSGVTGSRLLEILQSVGSGSQQPMTTSFFQEPAPAIISANYDIVSTVSNAATHSAYVSNQYEIEVGNFFTESDVNNRIDKLTSHFEKHRFYILQRKIPAGTIYQLVLGGFKNKVAATDAEKVLISEKYEPNIVKL